MKKAPKYLAIILLAMLFLQKINTPQKLPVFGEGPSAKDKIATFAGQNGISEDEWPDDVIELLSKNPETEEFVLNYPLKKNTYQEINMEEYQNPGEIPLFLQWDMRWGYQTYGNTVLGISGCGPTCLSMVCVYLFQDTAYHPGYIAKFSIDNGFCVPGNGSAWSLISEGGTALGLTVTEIPLDKDIIMRNLGANNPIICVVGPGQFTSDGHFIVLAGTENGKIKINDPNSIKNSEKLWDFEEIKDQILNVWVCTL